MTKTDPVIRLADVRFGFPDRPDFLGPVSVDLHRGQTWAIVGPNGAGKSTLLRLLTGLWQPTAGAIEVEGESLHTLPPRRRAQRIAYLPQQAPGDLDMTAREVVLLGRFPHRTLGLFESVTDYGLAEKALHNAGIAHLADRTMRTLSGGEAQRVHLAAALAQGTEILLLDEPTAALDPHHQLAIFRLVRTIADRGALVVAVTHDLNLALRFCDRALVMHDGRCVATGPPDETLTPTTLSPIYGVRMMTLSSEAPAQERFLVATEESIS